MTQKGSAIDLSQYIIRVYTPQYRYRFSLNPNQRYIDLLELVNIQSIQIQEKTGVKVGEFQVFSENGRKLNVKHEKMLKEVVYLRHGAVLKVELPKIEKNTAIEKRNVYIMNYNEPKSVIKHQSKCKHPTNMKCINCLNTQNNQNNYYSGSGLQIAASKTPQKQSSKCDHGPRTRCLRCLNNNKEQVRSLDRFPSILSTPKKVSPELRQGCEHNPKIKCFKCFGSPSKSKKSSFLQSQTSLKKIENPQQNSPSKKQDKSPIKLNRCLHGPEGKCLNCLIIQTEKQSIQHKKICAHNQKTKCIYCLTFQNKAAHLPFDQYLYKRNRKCNHAEKDQCPNCKPLQNLHLSVDLTCKNHLPYPNGLCNRCMPENITLKRQQYRHVDYVQFMNGQQIQDFINFWVKQRINQVRIGFLYGYYAEDPFYKNGIRAIVQALYEPEQRGSTTKFQLKDSQQKVNDLNEIIKALGLQKVGMIIASPKADYYFSEDQVRTIASFQQQNSVDHQSGYKLSNFFTVLVRPGKDGLSQIQPEVFMISDQGQALQAANLLIPSSNPKKMCLKTSKDQLLPTIYQQGKVITQFDIQFLLVNIASGMSNSNKFAILKNNSFPSLNRGRIKKIALKNYILQNFKKPKAIRYGDLNLLILIVQLFNMQTGKGIAEKISRQQEIDQTLDQAIKKKLQSLL